MWPIVVGEAFAPVRTVGSITVKKQPYFNADGFDPVPHWWIEIAGGTESYGFWPRNEMPIANGSYRVPGEVNRHSARSGLRGSPTRDPHHGEAAPSFHPVSTETSLSNSAFDARVRSFARSFSDNYALGFGGTDCHEFVEEAMDSAGLREPSELTDREAPMEA